MIKKLWLILCLLPLTLKGQNAAIDVNFNLAFSDSCVIQLQQLYIDDYEKVIKATINENHCSFNIAIEEPTVAKFIYNNQQIPIFLLPGMEMQINVGTDSIYKSVKFGGQNSAENQDRKSTRLNSSHRT